MTPQEHAYEKAKDIVWDCFDSIELAIAAVEKAILDAYREGQQEGHCEDCVCRNKK